MLVASFLLISKFSSKAARRRQNFVYVFIVYLKLKYQVIGGDADEDKILRVLRVYSLGGTSCSAMHTTIAHNFCNACALLEMRALRSHCKLIHALLMQSSALRVKEGTHCAGKLLCAMRILFKSVMRAQCTHCVRNHCRFYRISMLGISVLRMQWCVVHMHALRSHCAIQ